MRVFSIMTLALKYMDKIYLFILQALLYILSNNLSELQDKKKTQESFYVVRDLVQFCFQFSPIWLLFWLLFISIILNSSKTTKYNNQTHTFSNILLTSEMNQSKSFNLYFFQSYCQHFVGFFLKTLCRVVSFKTCTRRMTFTV